MVPPPRHSGERMVPARARPVPGANGGYVVIRKAVAAKPEPQPQLQEKPKKGKK